MCCQDPNRKRLASSHFEGGNLLTSAKRWETSPSVAKRSWIRADELVHVENLAKTFFYLRINFKIPFPFSSYSLTNYSSNHRWLFCALLWIYYDVNLFMQFCSSRNMTLMCRAPVYLFLLSPNKIYHNI